MINVFPREIFPKYFKSMSDWKCEVAIYDLVCDMSNKAVMERVTL